MPTELTPRVVANTAREEGLVLEAYRDPKGIWTWSLGIATTGGHNVLVYKDRPQPIDVALRAAIGLIRTRYMPAVLTAFAGRDLTEAQLAGALSFQWRNGTIGRAEWVKAWRSGDLAAARELWMQWTDHGRQINRAKRERALFFDGAWPRDLRVPVWSVAKPSYRPVRPVLTDIMPILQSIMGGR